MATRLGRLLVGAGKDAREAPLDGESLVERAVSRVREHAALLAVLALAAFLNIWNLSANGYGNDYYAAAVRSMTQSWHNFFFASFDPAGFITVDKPPVGLWVQAASAKLFGFSGMSILLPEALAGVGAVLVLYLAVSRVFGRTAGLVAGLALAVTPISVAINRSNNLDAWLALCTTVAAYCVVRAIEKGSLRWLVLSGLMIGVCFNTKTLAGFVAAPALFAAYAVTAPLSYKRRLRDLAIAGGVLAIVSASWVAAVDLTPASSRPWVGGSQENSELDLLLNYNGLGRIDGEENGPGARGAQRAGAPYGGPPGVVRPYGPPGPNGGPLPNGTLPPVDGPNGVPAGPGGGPGGGGPGGAGFTGGDAGVLRLFHDELSAQASWLLPLALIGGLASLLSFERRLKGNPKLGSLIVWGGWLLTAGVVFSQAKGIFHPYYLSYLGPAIGGVVGISVATFLQALRDGDKRALLAPVALIATAAFEVSLIDGYADWLPYVLVAGAGLGAVALLAGVLKPDLRRLSRPGLAVALAAVLLPPAVWSYSVVDASGNGNLPYVNPASSSTTLRRGLVDGVRANPALVQYLQANRGDAKYLVATESSMSASGIIISTGEPVMAMGGFSGSDPAVTASSIATMVDNGTVRFFLLGGAGGPPGAPGADDRPYAADRPVLSDDAPVRPDDGPPGADGGPRAATRGVTSAITTACKPVDRSTYGGTAPTGGGPGGAAQLYDCQGAGDAIRAAGARQ